MARRIGIMGGTFDPVHLGHLVAAEVVLHKLGLDEVVFVPTGDPPHKSGEPVSPAEHRYLMAVLATIPNPHFRVSRVDIDRDGPTYAVDTITDLRLLFGEEHRFWFIVGADAFQDLPDWRDPERLIGMCQWAVVSRPGFDFRAAAGVLGSLYDQHPERFEFITVPALSVSSTEIRSRVAAGEPIRYLVPESVEQYIRRQLLYTGGDRGQV